LTMPLSPLSLFQLQQVIINHNSIILAHHILIISSTSAGTISSADAPRRWILCLPACLLSTTSKRGRIYASTSCCLDDGHGHGMMMSYKSQSPSIIHFGVWTMHSYTYYTYIWIEDGGAPNLYKQYFPLTS
jgi:hypothetical protein